ncbi:MAG TPA: di-heme oxidoredictase family protein [Candidatus Dormibacteraeota bacterium]|nr:di-heme oxidoredictase family protein [Candidatus Dormibacteraeota bacterium]
MREQSRGAEIRFATGVLRRCATLLVCIVAWTGCHSPSAETSTWRSDCPGPDRAVPLSLMAAREAHRQEERRHELRLREAALPGSFMREMRSALDPDRMAVGQICLAEISERGQLLFEHEYGFADGLGGGQSATAPKGPFRRVHEGAFGGPETIACPSCHWVGGPNGAGAETDNALLAGDGNGVGSADARNPPALVGLGVVQALAKEMTRDLQRQRDALLRDGHRDGAARESRLVAKGVDFGVLRVSAKGELDTSGVRGVDADLVVKPFGWKGHFADIADFAADALQVHLGIQSDHLLAGGSPEVLGAGGDPRDPDGDGMRDELGPGPFTALVAHLALLEMPIVTPLTQDRDIAPAATGLLPPTTTSFVEDFRRGRQQFHALGCASCHVPMLVLESPMVEIDGLPPIDLAKEMRQPALTYDPALGGYPVWLFSDLKRHDMGKSNAAQHVQRGVPIEQYLTPRLWGVANSAPYLHDGRAPSFDYAIAGHDGEGAAARAAYAALSHEEKGDLRVYLMSLRRAPRVFVP